jgi:hypothetical protein
MLVPKLFGTRSESRANCLSVDPTTLLLWRLLVEVNSKHHLSNLNSLYIHGGRDLKEGPIGSMWRLNLSAI